MHRDQDIINPQIASRSFVMVEAADGKTRFWYARVLGIFHLQVISTTDNHRVPQRLDVLWIRWLGEDPGYVGNPGVRRLERVGYVPEGPFAFGFIDPDVVVRAAHLIPAFIYEKTDKLLSRSLFWDCQDGDWENYYVNPYVQAEVLHSIALLLTESYLHPDLLTGICSLAFSGLVLDTPTDMLPTLRFSLPRLSKMLKLAIAWR